MSFWWPRSESSCGNIYIAPRPIFAKSVISHQVENGRFRYIFPSEGQANWSILDFSENADVLLQKGIGVIFGIPTSSLVSFFRSYDEYLRCSRGLKIHFRGYPALIVWRMT